MRCLFGVLKQQNMFASVNYSQECKTFTGNEFDVSLNTAVVPQHRTLSRSFIQTAASTHGFYIIEINFHTNRDRTSEVYRTAGADDQNCYLGFYQSAGARDAHVRILDPVTRQLTSDVITAGCLVFEIYAGVQNDNQFVLNSCL